jgi:hypothetical protein
MTYLDKSLGRLQEVLLSVGFGSFLVPVNNRLVRNTVGIVQNLDDTRESLHDSSVGVAVDLNGINEVNLGFGAVTEWLQDGGIGLPLVEGFDRTLSEKRNSP